MIKWRMTAHGRESVDGRFLIKTHAGYMTRGEGRDVTYSLHDKNKASGYVGTYRRLRDARASAERIASQ